MSTLFKQLLWLALVAGTFSTNLDAQEKSERCVVPRNHHPWGHFEPDSWKSVRVVSETLDPTGTVTSRSTTETKTTLVDVDEKGFTIQVNVVVDLEGKQFESPVQIVHHGYCGQQQDQQTVYRRLGDAVLMIGGEAVTCEKREITLVDGSKNRTVTVFYSPNVSPYVLRRESSSMDAEGGMSSSVTEVVALNETLEVLGEEVKTSKVKTTVVQGKVSRVTIESVSEAVPGGVVRHTSQETDAMGRVVRRSSLELLGYEAVEAPEEKGRPPRRRLFGRRERTEETRNEEDNRRSSRSK